MKQILLYKYFDSKFSFSYFRTTKQNQHSFVQLSLQKLKNSILPQHHIDLDIKRWFTTYRLENCTKPRLVL